MIKKKILLLTTGKGGGHKSSSNAIKTAILALDHDVDVLDYDAMKFMPGYTGEGEQGYITLTSKYRIIWKLFFEITSLFRGISNRVLSKPIYKRFRILVNEYKPDLILSVHPCFVGSIIRCLNKMKLNIPVHACIIDLVKHSRLWQDKRCKTTFVPTKDMYDILLKKGFAEGKLVHSGFPINVKFSQINKKTKEKITVPNVLMVNPSLKRNKVTLDLILTVLEHEVNLTVITGSDKILKDYLDKNLPKMDNVDVCGYVFDMDNKLANADVLITKAGPNMILEAVKICVPVIITDHILGQEEKNYKYIVDNRYGLRCKSPKELRDVMNKLFDNNCALLKEFSKNECDCKDTDGALVVAQHLIKFLEKH